LKTGSKEFVIRVFSGFIIGIFAFRKQSIV
jgi:hypothetical protein